ncbi:MAG: argininosuccinate lyase [Elusimicrobiota bacterium]
MSRAPAVAKRLWQLQEAPDPVVEAYTTGEDPALDSALLRYEALGTLAHARGLERIGILSPKECLSLRNCFRTLLRREGFTILPSQEDIHTAVEQHLTAKLGELGRKVHAGRSRNDQVQTDLRLMLKDRLLSIHAAAVSAARRWARFGERHRGALMPGYTHLQRAMPTTLGHWAASHAEALLEGCRGLRWAFEEADACPLGSAAGFGVTLPLDRVFVARLLGFSRVQRNTLRVQTSRPRLEAAALSALALLARDLGTLSWDICLFSTAEFGFMSLDSAFTTGSSIMPQKRNPDVAELTRARAALFSGWLSQALSLGQLPSGYHRDYQLTKGPLLRALGTMGEMLDIVGLIPAALTIRPERCRAAVTEDMLAAQRAMELVRSGVPFREAYQRIAAQSRKLGEPPTAQGVVLPKLPGSPGNPGWGAIERDAAREEDWTVRRRAALDKAWTRLL